MDKAYVTDGDLGSGRPGSLQWHRCNLRQLNQEGRVSYITEAWPNLSDVDKLELTVFLITERFDGDRQ